MAKKLVNVIYKVDDAQLRKLKGTLLDNEKESKKLSNQLTDVGNKGKKAGKDAGDSFFNFGNIVKTISIVALAHQVLQFSKEVIRVRGEFQKFEAVLTNTLGSKSAALIALGRINDFAKSTPFGVAELTNSFIKLANRGVEPTTKEMRAIADLSATLGKDFDQVIEAILDINNPERWKEIGIKAETAGDKVKLSFRDATIEVDRTVRGVTDAVSALGQLNGVAGSTEAISGTLEGQMSNLSDTIDQLFNTIGYGNQYILSELIKGLSEVIDLTNQLLKGKGQRFQDVLSETLSSEIDEFNKYLKDLGSAEAAQKAMEDRRLQRMKEISDRQTEVLAIDEDELIGREKRLHAEEKERLMFLYDIYDQDLPEAIEETIKSLNKKAEAEKKANSAANAKKQAAESKRLGKEVNDYLAALSEQEMFQIKADLNDRHKFNEDTAKREADNAKRSAELQDYFRELKLKKEKEAADEAVKIAEDEAARKQQINEDLHYAAFTLARSLVDFAFSSRESELEQIQSFYDEQETLAGDNERARMEIDIKRERALKKAREEEKQEEKKQARNRIIAGTAVNIVEAFPNAVLMALAAALGIVQLGTVQKLRQGGWVKGPGTGTSDSVPIMGSNGEFMVNADSAGKAPRLLEAINSKKLTDQALRGAARDGGSFSDKGIRSELRNVIKELQENRPDDVVERHGRLMRAAKRTRDHVQYVRTNVMGDF